MAETKELTEKQKEALAHFEQGMSTKEAAAAMGIGYNAANEHRRALVKKGAMSKQGKVRTNRATPVAASNGADATATKAVTVHMPEVEKAIEALGERQETIITEMSSLNKKQSALAKESEVIARMKGDIEENAKALAAAYADGS